MEETQKFQIGDVVSCTRGAGKMEIMGVLLRKGTGDDGFRYLVLHKGDEWNEGRAVWAEESSVCLWEDETE